MVLAQVLGPFIPRTPLAHLLSPIRPASSLLAGCLRTRPWGVRSPQLVLSPGRLFMDILNSCTDCDEIQFMEDGSWCPMKPRKENPEVCQTSAFSGIEGTGAMATSSAVAVVFSQSNVYTHNFYICKAKLGAFRIPPGSWYLGSR